MSAPSDWTSGRSVETIRANAIAAEQHREEVAQARKPMPLQVVPKPRTHDVGFWASLYTLAALIGMFFAGAVWLAVTAWHHPAGAGQMLFVIALPPVAMLAVHLGNRRRA